MLPSAWPTSSRAHADHASAHPTALHQQSYVSIHSQLGLLFQLRECRALFSSTFPAKGRLHMLSMLRKAWQFPPEWHIQQLASPPPSVLSCATSQSPRRSLQAESLGAPEQQAIAFSTDFFFFFCFFNSCNSAPCMCWYTCMTA